MWLYEYWSGRSPHLLALPFLAIWFAYWCMMIRKGSRPSLPSSKAFLLSSWLLTYLLLFPPSVFLLLLYRQKSIPTDKERYNQLPLYRHTPEERQREHPVLILSIYKLNHHLSTHKVRASSLLSTTERSDFIHFYQSRIYSINSRGK